MPHHHATAACLDLALHWPLDNLLPLTAEQQEEAAIVSHPGSVYLCPHWQLYSDHILGSCPSHDDDLRNSGEKRHAHFHTHQ